MNWRCYVCGKPVAIGKFYLMSMQRETDRVFVACSQSCCDRADDVFYVEVQSISGGKTQ